MQHRPPFLASFLSIIVGWLAPSLHAELMVLQSADSVSPREIHRFDSRTGAARGTSHADTEAFVGLAAGPDGNAYIASNILGAATVYVFSGNGEFVRALNWTYDLPQELTFGSDGKLYAVAGFGWPGDTDYGVVKLDPFTGERLSDFINTGPDFEMRARQPTFGPDGHFYAINSQGVVRYHGTSGAFMGVVIPVGSAGLQSPSAMIFGPDGNLYVGSSSTHSILRFTPAGSYAGTFVPPASGGLDVPRDFAFGPDGNFYVASQGSGKILRYTWPSGAFRDVFVSSDEGEKPRHIAFASSVRVEVPWVDDALPSGAQGSGTGGDSWQWISATSPGRIVNPRFGTLAHQSSSGPGLHEHFFNFAQPFPVAKDDVLYAWVFIDESQPPPQQIMLSWKDDANWEHRAYWGGNLINAGRDGTDSRRHMGPVPFGPMSQDWVRLEIPAKLVGLEGKNLRGMSFSLYGGRVAWDRAGRIGITHESTSTPPPPPPPPPPQGDFTAWYDSGFPAGAKDGFRGSAAWTWRTASPAAPGASAVALHSTADAGVHEHHFNFASQTLTPAAGDKISVMVYIDPVKPPKQIVLSFCANRNWEHRAYWGDAIMRYAVEGSAGQKRVGNIPPGGAWVRLEIPAADINLVGQPIVGMSFTLYDGAAVFDRVGKIAP